MKSFVFALAAMAVFSAAAYYGLNAVGFSSENVYQNRDAVRLD
ncbi:MAG: hypothetical protein AAFQ88_04430 [Pseudomonadota bacterium]